MRINIFAIVVSVVLAFPAFAQDTENPEMPGMYDIPGFSPTREYSADSFDAVDPYMGNLKIVNTDMAIPLNGEIDLKIQRNYQPSQPGNITPYYGGQGGGWPLIGVGWDMHFGRIWFSGVIGTSTSATGCRLGSDKNRPVLELPDGSKQVLYNAIDSDKAFITQQRWIAKCLASTPNNPLDGAPEGGLLVYSPNGLKYTFARRGNAKYAAPAYVVTRIEDRNGNFINFTYRYDNDTQAYIRLLLLDSISFGESSLGTVRFTYEDPTFSGSSNTVGKNARIKYIDFSGRRLEYSYVDVTSTYLNGSSFADGRRLYQLSQVKLPDGQKWQYQYVTSLSADPRLPLKVVTSPLNGKYEYEYASRWVPALGGSSIDAANLRMVTKRTLKSSSGGIISEWQYQYGFSTSPDSPDINNVITPTGCVQYRHMGYASVNNMWRIGTLQRKTIFPGSACSGSALQEDNYSWESELISYNNQYLPRPKVQSTNTYLPRLTSSVISRDGTTYTKTLSNYDSYGNARRIVSQQSGQAAKTADYTYDVKTTPWVIHLLDTEYYGFNSNPNVDRVYDSSGNLTRETSFGKTNSFGYSNGEISSHTDPDSKVTNYSSYKMGTPRSETMQEGVSISRNVDSYGNVASETYNSLPASQIPAGHSDGAVTVSYGYDDANRITSINTPSGADSNYGIAYSFGASNTRTITRGVFRTTERFDNFGNKTDVIKQDLSGGVANPTVTASFSYDAVNRLREELYPSFGSSTARSKLYAYDALNRVKTIANSADGSNVSYDYQANNKVAITNEASRTTTYSYRAFDNPDEKQLIKIEAPESQTTTIDRNILGFVNYVQQGAVRHDYGYDSRMLLTSESRPEFGTIYYTRDDRGNMTSRRVGSSGTTSFGYDDLSRLKSIDYPNTTADVSRIWYNKFGKPRQINRGDSKWDYTYDPNNNLTNETLTLGGSINKAFGINRTYDALDQESSITYPTGKVYNDPRDALGRIKNINVGGSVSLVDNVRYHASGNYEQYSFGNGRTTTASETSRRWPAQFTVSGAGGPNFTYAYFNTGDVSSITDHVNSSRTRSFVYDGLHRLSTVTGNGAWGNAAFNYSNTGDILNKTIGGVSTTINYDPTTKRVSSLVNNSGTTTYSYDNYGNVAGRGNQQFFYDDASNLIWDGTTAAPPNFAYDGHNRRYWQIDAAGNETLSVYSLNGKLMYQEGKQDRTIRDYVYLDSTLVTRMDYCDTAYDDDGDQIPNCIEIDAGTNPSVADANQDKDGDGLTNLREYQLGTKINNPDTDGDGLSDSYEVTYNLNPLSAVDAHTDADSDGLDNYAEYLAGTNPRNADSDNDGIPDGQDSMPLFNVAVLIPIINLLLN